MFRVKQEIKTGIETNFVLTINGQRAVGALRLIKAVDGSLQLYAENKVGQLNSRLFVIDKKAGDEFIQKIVSEYIDEVGRELGLDEEDGFAPVYCAQCLARMGLDVDQNSLCGSCGGRKVREGR